MPRVKLIKVKIGSLTEQLKVKAVPVGTTVKSFLTGVGKDYSASVRLNGKPARAGTKLKTDDVITLIGEVSGGK